MTKPPYILPITKVYASYEEVQDDPDFQGHGFLLRDKKLLQVSDLAQGRRNLVIGEPGIGKSELLKRIKDHHDASGDTAIFISLRTGNPSTQIDAFVGAAASTRKVLILDALDEVQSRIFPDVLQKLEEVSNVQPEMIIYLSSRLVFVEKYASNFSEYRLIRIQPFTTQQVKVYLIDLGHSEAEVDALLYRIMQFSHGRLIVQVPRYLFLFGEYIRNKGIDTVSAISRNDLFEYFIYSKLALEDARLNTDSKSIIKRVLEKLALVMEIYQTNTISKDELLTFFDDIDSDLKLPLLAQVSLDTFIDKTVLQISKQDTERVEFDNAEFQEYLAAKEITRFAEPHRVAFSVGADATLNELFPSWFNTLTFVVDLLPDLLEQLMEFSGLEGDTFKVVDEGFLHFLGRVNATVIPSNMRKRVFLATIKYHRKTKQWLPGNLAEALPGFYSTDLENVLKEELAHAEAAKDSNRFVPLGNIAYIVAFLLESHHALDRQFWRNKFIGYANDSNENGVVQRHALFALQKIGDKTLIEELPALDSVEDELVARTLIGTYQAIDSEHPTSIAVSIQAVKGDEMAGRDGLYAAKTKAAIVQYLRAFTDDEQFRKEFLDDTSIFKERDGVLALNVEAILDSELEEICKSVIVKAVENYPFRSVEKSHFVNGLFRLLKKKSSSFVTEILGQINDSDKGQQALYYSQAMLIQVLEEQDISAYLNVMLALGQARTAMQTMVRIRYSERRNAEVIFEAGRGIMPKDYAEWEEAQAKHDSSRDSKDMFTLADFKKHLQPIAKSPNTYSTGLFRHYAEHFSELTPHLTPDQTKRLSGLAVDILKHNPAEHGLEITSQQSSDGGGISKEYRTSSIAHIFGEAFIAAKLLGVDLTPYRANIALFIPFAEYDELKEIFETFKDFTVSELKPVLEIYKTRNSDLWRHQPESFVRMVQQYHLVDATSVLKDFAKETGFPSHVRIEAMQTLDSLAPDVPFLEEMFALYKGSAKAEEKDIAHAANSLLITAHGDRKAVEWRLEQIKSRIVPFVPQRATGFRGMRSVENELRFDKPFAKPLSSLKHSGFEAEYLALLDIAVDLWEKEATYHTYAQYMWEIVISYFDNLKEHRSYIPLKMLDEKILSLKDKEGANWLAASVVRLRRAYLAQVGKPLNFSEAVRKYNEARSYSGKVIRNSRDLFHHLRDAIETDLRRWVEYQGAYNIIVSKKQYSQNAEYEKLVQMTIKSELSNIFRGRGFSVDISREEQLLNDKRVDFIVRYGFVGPIVLEVKLGSHSDLRSRKPEKSKSYRSMEGYMRGYGATHGVFLIMDDTGKPHVRTAEKAFGGISNVAAIRLDCFSPAKRHSKKVTPSRAKKKSGKARKKPPSK